MKVVFLGATLFSKKMLEALITNNIQISAVFAIPEKFSISYSKKKVTNYNYANLEGIAKSINAQFYTINGEPKAKITDYISIIKDIKPDLILVLGWYYMVPKKIRDLAKYGAWGIHASMLPKYAGGAPLNWAIINGETETGVTLFKLSDGVDDGDIIGRKRISIEYHDYISDVYRKTLDASIELIKENITNPDKIIYQKQDVSLREIYPQRTPDQGELNLNMTSIEMYNLIRALSNPYPGAFFKTIDGKKLIIERARIEE